MAIDGSILSAIPEIYNSAAGRNYTWEELLTQGWLPVVFVHPSFNHLKSYINGTSTDIQATQIVISDVIVDFPLAVLQSRQKSVIDSAWAAEEDKGFAFNGKVIQCRDQDRLRIMVAILTSQQALAAGQVQPSSPFTTWKTADNSDLIVTFGDIASWPSVMAAAGLTLFDKAQAYKTAISNATDADAVLAVVWEH